MVIIILNYPQKAKVLKMGKSKDKNAQSKTRMKKLLAFLTISLFVLPMFLVPSPARAESITYVSGTITTDTTWYLSQSPYIVVGNILVSQGVTLTIEPGVVIKFDLGMAMQVEGQLIARGTEAQRIVFTSIRDDAFGGDSNSDGSLTTPAPGDWGHILFTDPSVDAIFDSNGCYVSGSILEYNTVEYGGGQGAIQIDSSAPFLNQTIVGNSAYNGIYASQGMLKIANSTISYNKGRGIYVSGSGVTIVGNTISNNYWGIGAGIYDGTVIISNNVISNNIRWFPIDSLTYEGGGIEVEVSNGTCIISNNTVVRNGGIGIYAHESEWSVIESSYEISGNIVSYNSDGIQVGGAQCVINNNIITYNLGGGMSGLAGGTITNNIIAYNMAYSQGVCYFSDLPVYLNKPLTVSNNSIIGNVINIDNAPLVSFLDSYSRITFRNNLITQNYLGRSTFSYSVEIIGLPIINYNNLFNNPYSYELYNSNPSHLDAKNNWWGTSSEAEIEAKIYDFFDDPSKGIVDYTPYSTSIRTDVPISPPTNLIVNAEGNGFTLSWNPNPELDLAGYKIYYDTDSDYPYAYSVDVGKVTSYALTGLPPNISYFTVTAYDNEADGINDQFEGHESWYAPSLHDVAVTSLIYPVIYPNEMMSFAFSITNEGDFFETFNYTLYLDSFQVLNQRSWLGPRQNENHSILSNIDYIPPGNYTMIIEVSAVPGETNVTNNILILSQVEVPSHDITVTNVEVSTSRATPGDIVEINVTVENQGDFTESFTVSVFFDDILAASQDVINLASKDSTILNFKCDTTGIQAGEYTIKAQASTVVDDDIEDNTSIDGKVALAYFSPLIYYIIILVALASLGTVVLIFVRGKATKRFTSIK